jgi:valyl-tRNA synthetase
VVVGDVAGYLPLAGMVDLAAERERLAKELEEVAGRIEGSQDLLASEFAEKAPPHIVQRERDKLADLETTQSQLRERLERLSE